MNRKNVSERFDFARRVKVDYPTHMDIVFQSAELDLSPKDSLLSLVYAPDERTGLPTGDLMYLVSDKANPQVKEFILTNLMQDVSSAKNVANPSGLSDDALIELSRGSSESIEEYVCRLNHSIDEFKFMKEQLSKEQLPKDDVSAGSE